MTYKTQHPAYDNEGAFLQAQEALREYGYTDQSWHNDTCPCLIKMNDSATEDFIRVWIDYKDPAAREMDDMLEFGISVMCDGFSLKDFAFDTVEECIAKAKELTNPQKLTLRREFVLAKNYDEEDQFGVVYLTDDQSFKEGDYIENYYHITLEPSGGCGQHYYLQIENQGYRTNDDSLEELQMIQNELITWIGYDQQVHRENITITQEA